VKVEHLMTRDVISVSLTTSLKEVAALLTERKISGVPVCDRNGHVVGVVSEADILQRAQGDVRRRGRMVSWWIEPIEVDDSRVAARNAGDAMTCPAVTITPAADVAEAARLMIERGVNRLPVVENGGLLGIVTRADIVRAFHRSDDEITREIRADVLVHTLWISPETVDVAVTNGEVTLCGQVENRSAADMLYAYVRRVPGVVSVDSQLTWELDDLAKRTERAANHLPRRA
jgi:CBS domain-containing protein